MKYLIVLVVLAVAFFVWRSSRKTDSGAQRVPPRKREAVAQDMVACAHCGVHLPKPDAVRGRRAVYCGSEHLKLAGDQPQ